MSIKKKIGARGFKCPFIRLFEKLRSRKPKFYLK